MSDTGTKPLKNLDLILMMVWKTSADADAFGKSVKLPERGRLRLVRVVRDYGMFDRREAPQYYPAVEGVTGHFSIEF
jgi:hypothetical protein